MRRRIAQPPIDPKARSPEGRDFWPGFGVALTAAFLILWGFGHSTGLATADGNMARELELVRSFTRGGLEVVKPAVTLGSDANRDPVAAAAALENMAREEARGRRLAYRVNTGAVDPCPT